MMPSMGDEGGKPGLVGSPVSGLTNGGGRLWPSGLDMRRMDLGMRMGEVGDLGGEGGCVSPCKRRYC